MNTKIRQMAGYDLVTLQRQNLLMVGLAGGVADWKDANLPGNAHKANRKQARAPK